MLPIGGAAVAAWCMDSPPYILYVVLQGGAKKKI